MVDVYKAPEAELTKKSSSGKYGSIKIGTSGAYSFRIKKVFSEAWKLVKGAKLAFFVAFVLFTVCYFAVAFLSTTITSFFILGSFSANLGEAPEINPLVAGGAIVLGQILVLLLTTPLIASFFAMGVRRSGKKKISGGDIFSKFGSMLPLFFTMILYYILIFIGFLLLVLPGIYLSIAYLMAFPLVTEKGLGPWRALETSRKAVTKKWFKVFGFFILTGLITVISVIPLGIPYLIWGLPFTMIAYGIVYRNMFGFERER